jgi:hypothetical protein
MKYSELFGVPFWHGNIENNKECKSALLPIIKSTLGDIETPPSAWYTKKLFTSFEYPSANHLVFNSEAGKKLTAAYWNAVNKVMSGPWTADIKNCWFNYYEDGEWQEAHHHIDRDPLDFVLVHFLSFDNTRHKPIIFHDPIEAVRANTLNHTVKDRFSPELKEGDWVIFPPYLFHSVPEQPSTPDYPRITISWNIHITKFGDDDEKN